MHQRQDEPTPPKRCEHKPLIQEETFPPTCIFPKLPVPVADSVTLFANEQLITTANHGLDVSSFTCFEIFAGSAGLSTSLKQMDFTCVPIDHKFNRHKPKVKCISLDLSIAADQNILLQWIDDKNTAIVFGAPPCGTASRARELPVSLRLTSRGAPSPLPLRSDEFPRGLPSLQGKDLEKVLAANCLYDFMAVLCHKCFSTRLPFCVENPSRSHFWSVFLTSLSNICDAARTHLKLSTSRAVCLDLIGLNGLALFSSTSTSHLLP